MPSSRRIELHSVRPEPLLLALYLVTVLHRPGGAERDAGWGATCWPRIQARRCLPSCSRSLLQCRGPSHPQGCWPIIVGGGQGHLRDLMALQQPTKACSSEYVTGNENRGACKEPETENRQQEFQSEHELFLSTPVAGEALRVLPSADRERETLRQTSAPC